MWVRNSRGTFERLGTGASVVAVEALAGPLVARPSLRFRFETDGSSSSLTVPVEYRVRVGAGEHAAVWTVQALVGVEPSR